MSLSVAAGTSPVPGPARRASPWTRRPFLSQMRPKVQAPLCPHPTLSKHVAPGTLSGRCSECARDAGVTVQTGLPVRDFPAWGSAGCGARSPASATQRRVRRHVGFRMAGTLLLLVAVPYAVGRPSASLALLWMSDGGRSVLGLAGPSRPVGEHVRALLWRPPGGSAGRRSCRGPGVADVARRCSGGRGPGHGQASGAHSPATLPRPALVFCLVVVAVDREAPV